MGTLSKVVSGLKKAHPKLDVRVLSGKASELAGRVEDGDLDAAFLVEAGRKMASTRWTPLYEEELVVIAPPGAPAGRAPGAGQQSFPAFRPHPAHGAADRPPAAPPGRAAE